MDSKMTYNDLEEFIELNCSELHEQSEKFVNQKDTLAKRFLSVSNNNDKLNLLNYNLTVMQIINAEMEREIANTDVILRDLENKIVNFEKNSKSSERKYPVDVNREKVYSVAEYIDSYINECNEEVELVSPTIMQTFENSVQDSGVKNLTKCMSILLEGLKNVEFFVNTSCSNKQTMTTENLKILSLDVKDVRFPTSLEAHGSDAMHTDPDYSCAYVILKTAKGTEGHGLTFTCGRGTEIIVKAIESLSHLVVGQTVVDIFKDFAKFWRHLTSETQIRWYKKKLSIYKIVLGVSDVGGFFKLQLALRKDHSSRRAFEEQCSSHEIPSYSDLILFITERSKKLSLMARPSRDNNSTSRISTKICSISNFSSKGICKPKPKEIVKNTIVSSGGESIP
ncbi:hypothetical protein FQA39_LY06617 [Lamprigera yunnana]|nr:hypothetical protein FQA39_LY06617 [Lamprigera yunnana]